MNENKETNAAIEALKIVKEGRVGSLEFRLAEIRDAKNHISEVEKICRRLEKDIEEIDAGIKELS